MSTKIQIKQHLEPITQDKLDTAEQAILLLPEVPSGRWPDFPYIKEVKSRLKRLRPNAGKKLAPVHLDLPNRTGTRLGLCTVTADLSSFELLGCAFQIA
jgi:hypothetical protein